MAYDPKDPTRNPAGEAPKQPKNWTDRVMNAVDKYADAAATFDGAIVGPKTEEADRRYYAKLKRGDIPGAVQERVDSMFTAAGEIADNTFGKWGNREKIHRATPPSADIPKK